MLEKELRANWDSVFYPEPEPEVETFGEEVQAVDEPVLLAAGPSGTMTDAGAAFGVFPQMKPRRAGASEVGANLPLLAADVAAGAGKGLVSGSVGLAGDVLAIGRGLYEIGRRGGDQSALDAFLQGMEKGLILPTSDDVDKWLTKNIGPVVPPGGPIQSAREGAAGVGRFAGEVVADPFVAIKGVKAAAKGAKALAPKAGEMLDAYVQRTGMQANLMAYHGTPHTVDKFDAAKIGTGEGAQAYGYGLYFAESKDVAQGYRVKLAFDPEKMKVGGRQINTVYRAIENAAAKMPPAQAQAEYEKLDILERLMMNEMPADLQEAADAMSPATKAWFDKTVKPSFETYGNLYTVDIPDAVVAKMLDFDAPISSQSKEIQALAKKYKIQPEDLGGDLLAAANGKTKAGAQLLREAGIPGVRYLDQGSRGDQQGTRNIVVFPGSEGQVKILKREGQGK
jgi:hypothetical protein